MASKREVQKWENRAKRFLRTCLKAWRAQSIDDLPDAARVALLEVLEEMRVGS